MIKCGGAGRLSLLPAICGIPRTERRQLSDKEAVKHPARREAVAFGEALDCFVVGQLVWIASVIILSLIHSILADSTDSPCASGHQAEPCPHSHAASR